MDDPATRRTRPARRLTAVFLVLLSALFAQGCREVASLRERVGPASPHEAYARSLRRAGLHEAALGREWIGAGERALRGAHPVTLPHREAVFFPPEEAHAAGFGFRLRQGERLRVEVELGAGWQGRAFVDLFLVPEDTGSVPRRLSSADSTPAGLTWVAREDGAYRVRVQPELLRGGRLTLTLRTGPSLAFPVPERDSRAVGSAFGAPRDGGSREHHGIDIFAPRGTPVVAAAGGTVRSVETTGIGGKVVWLWDGEQRLSIYYAHLDSQAVEAGARLRAGDTLGTVGNTGNALGTPPHLHFGIYRPGRGPVDPYPFVHVPRAGPPEVRVEVDDLGAWRRTTAATRLRAAPAEQRAGGRDVARHVPVRPLGGSGAWYRVRLPDGAEGYLSARGTEPAARPLRSIRLPGGRLVLSRPVGDAPAVDSLPAGADVPSLGEFGGSVLVRTPAGRLGWVLRPE
ncbi:MAG TPA: M23 family metallopeptidase [Longimicrobiaceae bacterium]